MLLCICWDEVLWEGSAARDWSNWVAIMGPQGKRLCPYWPLVPATLCAECVFVCDASLPSNMHQAQTTHGNTWHTASWLWVWLMQRGSTLMTDQEMFSLDGTYWCVRTRGCLYYSLCRLGKWEKVITVRTLLRSIHNAAHTFSNTTVRLCFVRANKQRN